MSDGETSSTTSVGEEGVSLLRRSWARWSLWWAVKAARCTNTLNPSRREQSYPRGQRLRRWDSSPHDTDTSIANWLGTNIQGDEVALISSPGNRTGVLW